MRLYGHKTENIYCLGLYWKGLLTTALLIYSSTADLETWHLKTSLFSLSWFSFLPYLYHYCFMSDWPLWYSEGNKMLMAGSQWLRTKALLNPHFLFYVSILMYMIILKCNKFKLFRRFFFVCVCFVVFVLTQVRSLVSLAVV